MLDLGSTKNVGSVEEFFSVRLEVTALVIGLKISRDWLKTIQACCDVRGIAEVIHWLDLWRGITWG